MKNQIKLKATTWVLLLFFVMILACGKNTSNKKKPAIKQSKLTAFLIDIYLAEAKIEVLNIPKDSGIKLFSPREKEIIQKHHLSDSALRHIYQYYAEHPKEWEEIYDVIIDSLSLREQRGNKKINNDRLIKAQ